MHNILCLNKISPLGTDRLGENYTYAAEIENPEGILVRSAAMHDMELPNSLLAIARAGAGVNNIPVEKCAEAGVQHTRRKRQRREGAGAGGTAFDVEKDCPGD